jgi:glutamine---fructose-6-phosphate transaminase (isomerizing)
MCGIVGYIGQDKKANDFIIDGLKSLEYRGYDSAGIATVAGKQTSATKQVGKVDGLEREIAESKLQASSVAIGHTRWATHGSPTVTNAHPHQNTAGTIHVVHNGIIENYQDIKTKLKAKGYKFVSQTDTEVIPHLIDHHLKNSSNFKQAFIKTLKDLRGAYAIAAISSNDPESVYVAKLSSPLIIGVGKNFHCLASDATALMSKTKKVIYLEDYEVAQITPKKVSIKNIKKDIDIRRESEELAFDLEEAILG